MNTGDRIRIARIRAGLTQKELAQKVGVQFSAIHKYESGAIVNLKRETISALSEALNVKPSWLLCLDEGPIEDPVLKKQHDEINELFDRLPPELRTHYIALLKGLVQASQSPDAPKGSD